MLRFFFTPRSDWGGQLPETKEEQQTTEGTKEKPEESKPSETPADEVVVEATEPPGTIDSKESALNTPVEEASWKKSRAEVENLVSLLEIYTKNYHLAREQYAKFGSALVPPIIVHNLEEAEKEIASVTEELRKALSQVYGKQVVVLDE